jgi:hypothetical protein
MFFLFNIFYRDTVNEHHHLRIAQAVTAGFNVIPGMFEGAGFQSLVIKDEAAACPMKQFYFVAGFVDKDIYITAHGRLTEFVLNQAAQGVKTFTHIGGLAVEMKF